ncbi:MAG: hypothetical protein H6747_13675 [Deltaproteobacteria bacterium]|nr:hypothetical protein [Deltaproteobacteria bacterium]
MEGLADLHRHLDGSMRAATLRRLAAEVGAPLPELPRFFAGMGLDAALACFATTLRTLQRPAAIAEVAAEIAEDAARDGVTTLELRFAPQLHCDAVGGAAAPGAMAAMAAAVDAALEGLDRRAGLLLCVLYGDPPALAEALVDLAATRPGVVGVDLAGGPAPTHDFAMTDYAPAFRRARGLGLGVTVHAGEGRPPAEIAVAIEQLGALRIGHGTTLLDDPAVTELVATRGVTIEACVTSNVHVGAVATAADHPLPRWLAMGIKACVNTDNTLLSAVDAAEEHRRVRALPGMDDALLAAAVAHGHAAAFVRG